MKQYDYLIVGAGLFGCVFAHEMHKNGKKCLIIDKRNHIGGNVFCSNIDGINVHEYGAHIFHTNDKKIWQYVNSFVEFNNYINSPLVNYKGRIFNLPFNMNTFSQLWGVTSPAEALHIIESQVSKYKNTKARNLEEQALSLVGKDIYEIFIKGYSEKQWGRRPDQLPAFIIKRIPVRFIYSNNYFEDKFQGIPVGGYNRLIEKLTNGIEIKLGKDYHKDRSYFDSYANKIVYSGKIDEFFNFSLGRLQYRSLKFEHERLNTSNYQGNAVVNYTEKEVPFTRIIEHKHFEFGHQNTTIITREFPCEHDNTNEPYYPINDCLNNDLFQQYKKMAENCRDVIFGGRLAEFRYYDMHQVIASALVKADLEVRFFN